MQMSEFEVQIENGDSVQFVHTLVEKFLDAGCKVVQDAVGQTDGGLAAQYWSDTDMRALILDYIKQELENRASYLKFTANRMYSHGTAIDIIIENNWPKVA